MTQKQYDRLQRSLLIFSCMLAIASVYSLFRGELAGFLWAGGLAIVLGIARFWMTQKVIPD